MIESATLTFSQDTFLRSARGRQLVKEWDVVTDDPLDNPESLIGQSPIPDYEDEYESDGIFAVDINISRRSPRHYAVRVTYRTPGYDTMGGGSTNPLNEPARISRRTRQVEEEIDIDANGAAIVNSAGEPYSGVTRPVADVILRVTKNVSTDPVSLYLPLMNTVNSGPIYGFAARTALLAEASDDKVITQGLPAYWQLTLEWHLRDGGWKRRIPDEGFRMLEDIGGSLKPVTIVDEYGYPLNRPTLLNGSGAPLLPGSPLVVNEFELFKAADHSPLVFI